MSKIMMIAGGCIHLTTLPPYHFDNNPLLYPPLGALSKCSTFIIIMIVCEHYYYSIIIIIILALLITNL